MAYFYVNFLSNTVAFWKGRNWSIFKKVQWDKYLLRVYYCIMMCIDWKKSSRSFIWKILTFWRTFLSRMALSMETGHHISAITHCEFGPLWFEKQVWFPSKNRHILYTRSSLFTFKLASIPCVSNSRIRK